MQAVLFDNEILDLIGIDEVRKEEWDKYTYDSIGAVPRVTNILKQCRDSEGLIQWASNVGRSKYLYYREKALSIGTIVHELIDEYISYVCPSPNLPKIDRFEINYSEIDGDYRSSVYNCIENFKLWINKLNEIGCPIQEVIGLEIPIVCPWYGGTVDGIIKINGMNYIIDFKTSKSISPEYLLQVAAYMWIINNGYVPNLPHIDGIGRIRVDKSKPGIIDDIFLNEYKDSDIILGYQKCFASYVEAFYRTINTNCITRNYTEKYIREDILK